MPRTSKQRPPAKPPTVSAAAMRAHDKRINLPDVPALLAALADRFGVRPSDVPEFGPALPALREAGVDPAKVSPATVNHAGGLWRAGIAESLRVVDRLNEAVLRRCGDTSQVAEGGEVRRVRIEPTPQAPPANKRPATEKPRKGGLEILGVPATQLLRSMGRAGFTFAAARAAMDELGGIGVGDGTIRAALLYDNGVEELALEQLAELEPFRDAQPEPRPEKRERLERVAIPLVDQSEAVLL